MAREELTPQLPLLTSDDLLNLAYNLRNLGFNIDTRHFINAYRIEDILLAYKVEGEILSPARLKTILSPIFCSTPEEQVTFYAYFDTWLSRNKQISEKLLSADGKQKGYTESQERKGSFFARNKWCRDLFLIILIALPITCLLFTNKFLNTHILIPLSNITIIPEPALPKNHLEGIVLDQNNRPVPDARVKFINLLTFTDSTGCFNFGKLPGDTIGFLSVEHPEYLSKKYNGITSITEKQVYNIFLWPKLDTTPSVIIEVKDISTSEAIPAARVNFLKTEHITNDSGRTEFTYQQKDSSAIINIIRDGYNEQYRQFQLNGFSRPVVSVNLEKKLTSSEEYLKAQIDKINKVELSNPSKWKRFYQQYFRILLLLTVLLPLLLFLVWIIIRWYRKPLILERETTNIITSAKQIVVKWMADYIFSNPLLRSTIQQFRRHRESAGYELDPAGTVKRTVDNAGLFTAAYRQRSILPEYLVLIDRTGFNDQQAEFVNEVINRFVKNGVIIDRYYFRRDPRYCQPEDEKKPEVSLKELNGRHPLHRLLVFSDAEGFIDPLTGRAFSWVNNLLQWQKPALFVPEQNESTRYLNYIMEGLGFRVLPSSIAGLKFHIQTLQVETDYIGINWDSGNPLPQLLDEKLDKWLQRTEPDNSEVEELLAELRLYLDREGMLWLSACAVYPELHWQLTLYLTTMLTLGDNIRLSEEEQLLLQKRLLALTRLPWFRYGSMPEWFRLRLIGLLDNNQHLHIRRIIRELLLSAKFKEEYSTDNKERDIKLPFATKNLAFHFKNIRYRIAGIFQKTDKDNSLSDSVFIGYLSGGRKNVLAVLIPNKIKHIFFRNGQIIFGFKPLISLIFSLLISTAIFFTVSHLEPKPESSEIIPKLTFGKFTTAKKGEISAGVSVENLGFYLKGYYSNSKIKALLNITGANPVNSVSQNDTVSALATRLYLNLLRELFVQKTGFDTTLLTFCTRSEAGLVLNRDLAEPLYLVNLNDITGSATPDTLPPNSKITKNIESDSAKIITGIQNRYIVTEGPLRIDDNYILTGNNVEYQALDKNLGPFSSGYPDAVIFHSTVTTEDIEKTSANLKKGESSGFWHIIIGRDGKIIQLVPFNMKAAHAGISPNNLRENYNNKSVGIALQNAGRLNYDGKNYGITNMRNIVPASEVVRLTHKNESEPDYWQDYTDIQVSRAEELCLALMEKFKIIEIIGHDDVAPDRTTDPGPAFPLTDFQKKLLGEASVSSYKLKMTGKWSMKNVEFGELLTDVKDYQLNGELSSETVTSDGRSSKTGHWQLSGDILNEQFSDGQTVKYKVRWTSDNSFELTIIDNGSNEYAGLKRNYSRIDTGEKTVDSATEYLFGTWEGNVRENGKDYKIIFNINSDGSFHSDIIGQDSLLLIEKGTWQYSNKKLKQEAVTTVYDKKLTSDMKWNAIADIKWITPDSFELTIIDNGVPTDSGTKREFKKMFQGEISEALSRQLVGKWEGTFNEFGTKEKVIVDYYSNGTFIVKLNSTDGSAVTDIGNWEYSDGLVIEKFQDNPIGIGRMRWIDRNHYEFTIIDNGDPRYAGIKRNLVRSIDVRQQMAK
jgi:N-acetyl-anhydromuramyl-L-alanine amidase AmpD